MISYEELSQVFDMDNPLTMEYFELCGKDTNINQIDYFEKHHILPKSIWPEYAKGCSWNIVKLSYQDHYRVHEILPLITIQKQHCVKMSRAWNMMSRVKGVKIDGTVYAELRDLHKDAISGENCYMFGKKLSAEHKAKLLLAVKGVPLSADHKDKISAAHKGENAYWWGKKHDDEYKRKMAASTSGERNGMFGRKHTEESKERMRSSIASAPISEKRIAAYAKRKGIKRSKESIDKQIATMKLNHQNKLLRWTNSI